MKNFLRAPDRPRVRRATGRSRSGFTLLEAMVAVAILSIALVVLIKSQTQSMSNVLRVQNYERGVYITENQLHWTFLDLGEAEDWSEYSSLSGEDGDYRWSVTIDQVETESIGVGEASLLRIVAVTEGPEGGEWASFQLETFYTWGRSQQ